jgi:hypothetical protein
MKIENETAIEQLFGEYVKLYPDLFKNPTHETIKIINLFVKYNCVEEKQIINAIDSFFEYKNWPKELPTKGKQYYQETFEKEL